MALYLTYRPQDFASIVGQSFIKETLRKAVAEDKTVGAYLFTGPRGTGKTSTARIFAKAINCENLKEGNPCNTCKVCNAFNNNSLIDIIEIDAASYTGVDNIRDIIEKAQFQPTQTKYKIYIIDEVHMLSKGAFNALLKILEEPPKHVKFILATTEIHKVPDTILSRCQRYDFRNHTDEDVKERLTYIAKQEGISVDEESYNYIVKSAEGGLRNAISLFEQLISDKKIEFSHIVETLGIASEDEKNNFREKLLTKDSSLIDDFEDLLQSGKNMKNFFKDIMQDIQKEAIIELKAGKSIQALLELLETLQDTLMKVKQSFDETMTLRIGVLKIVQPHLNSSPQGEDETAASLSFKEKEFKSEVIKKEKPLENTSLLEKAQSIFESEAPFEDLGGHMTPDQDFQMNTLIEKVKKLGARAAMTMSLKGSSYSVQDHILNIQTKTTIAHSTLDKPENRECILKACGDMGMSITVVQIS